MDYSLLLGVHIEASSRQGGFSSYLLCLNAFILMHKHLIVQTAMQKVEEGKNDITLWRQVGHGMLK